jgi:hypothetical protein
MRYFLSALVAFSLCCPVRAISPRLSNGVELVASGGAPTPCQTATACAAVPNAEILYSSYTSANGCSQIWSMSATGTHKTNISAEVMANIGTGIIDTSTNQGNPKYSPNGVWVMISYQEIGSAYACSAHAVVAGAATDYGILICDAATYANCAAVYTVTAGTGHGALHPQWAQDGTKIFWNDWNADNDIQEGIPGSWRSQLSLPALRPRLGLSRVWIHSEMAADIQTGTSLGIPTAGMVEPRASSTLRPISLRTATRTPT